MLLTVCLDDDFGMMFGARRQSRDRELVAHMLTLCEGRTLWMSPYSAALFGEQSTVVGDDDYADKVQAGDACFVENGTFPALAPSTIVVYRWNRRYPADRRFPEEMLTGYQLVSTEDFVGSSHERITAERYEREETI